MVATKIFTLLAFFLEAEAFFYRAIPMVYGGDKVDCPKYDIDGAECKLSEGGLGFVCNGGHSGLQGKLLNPVIQGCSTLVDLCADASNVSDCAKFTTCHTLPSTNRICTCGPGFMGNPYTGCYRPCVTDLDCFSPFSECRKEPGSDKKVCRCSGCGGDGILCNIENRCTLTESQKNLGMKCLHSGLTKVDYICPAGYFHGPKYGECVKNVTLERGKVLSFAGKAIPDGSRIDAGTCLSMLINIGGKKSIFSHLNGGNPVVIHSKLVATPSLYVAFEIDETGITAYSLLDSDRTKLTKLYTISNTSLGCTFDSVTRMDAAGIVSLNSDVTVTVRDISEADKAKVVKNDEL